MNCIREKGFTLIEVLIALAILALALTAVIYGTSNNIRQTAYLNDRTLATLAGLEIINEIQLKLRKISTENTTTGSIEMGDITWQFKISLDKTSNKAIQKISVKVCRDEAFTKCFATLGGFYDEKF